MRDFMTSWEVLAGANGRQEKIFQPASKSSSVSSKRKSQDKTISGSQALKSRHGGSS
jgi:hypothetical protein